MLDRFEDLLVFQTVLEGRLQGLAFGDSVDEVSDGVHESVFVPNDMPRWPPLADVRMHAIFLSNDNVGKSLTIGGRCDVEKLQPVHVLEVKFQRPFGAVDFKMDMVLAAGGVAGGLEVGEGAVFESSDALGGIVHGHAPHLLGVLR